jgi:UDP:flavonoid glycosyltransferase YjiC (YdhE family)
MPRYLLAPFGSAGDVNPFLWLGKLLQARGHEVTVVTMPFFREFAGKAGLEFVAIGEERDYAHLLAHPALWKPWFGTALVFRTAMRAMRRYYDALSKLASGPDTVIAAPLTLFAGRALREKYRVPLVTVHLQPAAMISTCDNTILFPGMDWFWRLPPRLKSSILSLPNPAQWYISRTVRRFYSEAGIHNSRRVFPGFPHWFHSPDANLLLFPEWFAPRQPDWPKNAVAAGFPLADMKEHFSLPPDLAAFLEEGEKPVLLSPGTGNIQARKFFEIGLAACKRIGRRALLGTTHPEQLPPLPSFARAFQYLPFSQILPRAGAIVHHGGIGTLSQGFAAGVPQLIMSMAHDQPDNARRARLLGVAEELRPRQFTVDNVASALERLLKNPDVDLACRTVAEKLKDPLVAERAVQVMEDVAVERV